MPDGDGAALRVEDAGVEFRQGGETAQRLGGVRLVEFDGVQGVEGAARLRQGLADGVDRAEAEVLRLDARHRTGADSGQWLTARLGQPGLVDQQQGSRAVVERRGVAGRDRAARTEDRLEAGQRFE